MAALKGLLSHQRIGGHQAWQLLPTRHGPSGQQKQQAVSCLSCENGGREGRVGARGKALHLGRMGAASALTQKQSGHVRLPSKTSHVWHVWNGEREVTTVTRALRETGQVMERETSMDEVEVSSPEADPATSTTDGSEPGVDYFSDAELQSVVQEIAAIEKQSDEVAQQMTEHARLLAEASKRLRARAQATRLEAAKLKKVARMQAAEELRRREEMRLSRSRMEDDARKQQQMQRERALALQQQQQDQNEEVMMLQAKLGEMQQQVLQGEEERKAQEEKRAELEKQLQVLEEQQQLLQQQQAKLLEEQTAAAAEESMTEIPKVNGVAVPAATNGAAISSLGAAVLPFSFPNGKHSGSELDSALIHGPALEGGEPVTDESDGDSESSNSGVMEESSSEGVASHLEHAETGEDNWQVTEDLECEIAHPGAMSCTKVVVRKDAAKRVAVVSMETTVRCNGDGCYVGSLDTEDFAALAMSTLAQQANEMKHSKRFQGAPADADPRIHQRRKEIEELLQWGEVVSCKAMEPPSKFGHESFIVDLKNKKSGKQIRAMFKPRVEGDADGWHRASVEWIAYELNLLLGLDYIPPVAYRKGGVDLGGGVQYQEGAFIYWVPDARELQEVPAPAWGVSVARLLSDTRILDILLNNSDRHHGHFLYGEHWTDGHKGVVLIDHAAGFRKEATVNMEHDNAFQTGAVKCVSAHTYLRLRFLDRTMVEERFRDMLSTQEISGLMDRKTKVLRYLDRLVQERGYHRTVVE